MIPTWTMQFLSGKGGYFDNFSKGSETFYMTYEELGEIFEGDFVYMSCMLGGGAEGLSCADLGAEISRKFHKLLYNHLSLHL